ncbi:hypothetical protein ACHAWF_012770, partial [Thalassiosira exigua]
RFLKLGSLLFLRLLKLLDVTVKEQIHRHIPVSVPGNGPTQTKDLAGEEPVNETNRVLSLVVGGYGDVHVLQRRVGITESDDGDVDVAALAHGLGVRAGVRHDQQAWFPELLRDLVGEGSGGEPPRNALGAGVMGELEHGPHPPGTGRDSHDVLGVLDGDDDAGGESNLLPRLADVEDVETVLAAAPDVLLHAGVRVTGPGVDSGGEHHLDVLLPGPSQKAESREKAIRRISSKRKHTRRDQHIQIASTYFGWRTAGREAKAELMVKTKRPFQHCRQ